MTLWVRDLAIRHIRQHLLAISNIRLYTPNGPVFSGRFFSSSGLNNCNRFVLFANQMMMGWASGKCIQSPLKPETWGGEEAGMLDPTGSLTGLSVCRANWRRAFCKSPPSTLNVVASIGPQHSKVWFCDLHG